LFDSLFKSKIKLFPDFANSLMNRTGPAPRAEKTHDQVNGTETPESGHVRVLPRPAPGMPTLLLKEKFHASGPR
jgi:hypothetical protein